MFTARAATNSTVVAGVLEELEHKPRVSAEQAIRDARELVSCAPGVPEIAGTRS